MSGTVGVGNISVIGYPDSNRVPGFYAGVDPSGANTGVQSIRAILIGQANAQTAPALLNMPVLSEGLGNAQALYGGNSPLAQMVDYYRRQDSFGELWELPLAATGSGTPAVGSIAVTGPATNYGTLSLYIAGVLVPVVVNANDTAAIIATNIAAAIALVAKTLLVTATSGAAMVTFNATFAGAAGNDIDIRYNYLGSAGGEALPAGVGITITPMSGGTGQQSLAVALANLPDLSYDLVVCSQNDPTTLAAIAAFLNDQTGRWAWNHQLFGHAIYCKAGSLGTLAAFGTSFNDQHATVVGLFASPTPPFVMAANVAGVAAVSIRQDPALPIQNLATDILAPALSQRFQLGDRNTLLYDGISTFKIGDDGTVFIERLITLYRINAAGVADDSYLDIETMNELTYVIRDLKSYLATNYGRSKEVSDTTRIATGSNVASSATIAQSIVNRYNYLQDTIGIVQNAATFAMNLVVQYAGNGLFKVRAPIDLAGQIRTIAMDIAFTKS